MLRHNRQQASRPRRARIRDPSNLRGQLGIGSSFRGASTGLERRGGGDRGSNSNDNNNNKSNNKNNNNNDNDNKQDKNDKDDNNKKNSPDSKSKDQPSASSPPPPPPPPPTSTAVVVSSVTSTLLTTATLTTIEQSSSVVQITSVQTSSVILSTASSSIEPPSSSSQTTSAIATPLISLTEISSSTTATSQITTSAAPSASIASETQVLVTTGTIPTDAASISASPGAHGPKHHGLSKSAQAGIAVGVICLVLFLAVGALHLVLRRRRRREQSSAVPSLRSRLSKADAGRASSPEMTGPLVAELDSSVAGGSDRRSSRTSNFSLSSSWAPSSVSSRSRTSVSELGKDAISEVGTYRGREQHMSTDSFSAGLFPPPSITKREQRGWNQWKDMPGTSLDGNSESQLARSDLGASASEAPSNAVSSVPGQEPQDVGAGGLRIVSIFPEKKSSRTVQNSASGGRFSAAELEGDTFYVPGREPAPGY